MVETNWGRTEREKERKGSRWGGELAKSKPLNIGVVAGGLMGLTMQENSPACAGDAQPNPTFRPTQKASLWRKWLWGNLGWRKSAFPRSVTVI